MFGEGEFLRRERFAEDGADGAAGGGGLGGVRWRRCGGQHSQREGRDPSQGSRGRSPSRPGGLRDASGSEWLSSRRLSSALVHSVAVLCGALHQLPDVGFHVVAGDHPEGVVVDEDAGGVAGFPGGVGELGPGDAVGGVPDVVPVAAVLVVAFEDPQAVVEDGDVVVLAGVPGGGWRGGRSSGCRRANSRRRCRTGAGGLWGCRRCRRRGSRCGR